MKKLKTGDKVVVVSGSNKGKEGKITKILDSKVIVEGVNIVKKHLKPKNNGGNGEIKLEYLKNLTKKLTNKKDRNN